MAQTGRSDIADTGTTEINDSKSFASLLTSSSTIRDFQYSEMNDGTSDIWTIRSETYKLIVNTNGNQEMYDLSTDAYEENDLLLGTLSSAQQIAKTELENELLQIRQ